MFIMDNQDKKGTGKKFLIPFSPRTPNVITSKDLLPSSSIFPTPPSSTRETAGNQRRLKKLGEIPKFELSDDEEEETKLDILFQLQERAMVSTVCRKILKYLDNVSLFRASHVSQSWRYLIQSEFIARERLKRFLKKKKEIYISKGKENIVCKTSLSTESHSPKRSRDHSPWTEDGKYRPCPKCSSPARVSDELSATCCSCCEQFCIHCFRSIADHGSGSCSKSGFSNYASSTTRSRRGSISNGQSSSQLLVGGKQSKKRLRRLSVQLT